MSIPNTKTQPSAADHPRPERPVYSKFAQEKPNPEGTQLWGITCNEGWCESIVCTGMYEWAADWLLEQIQYRRYGNHGRAR